MNNNTCVICGAIIPEGQQVCWKCFVKATSKKIGVVAVALSALAAPAPKVHAEQYDTGTLMKDVNYDGVIDGRDASMVLSEYARVSVGKMPTFTHTQKYVADVDLDKEVTAIDASMILSTYAINSGDRKVPIKTVTFGVSAGGQLLDFQGYRIEDCYRKIEDERVVNPKATYNIVACVTTWLDNDINKATYVIR